MIKLIATDLDGTLLNSRKEAPAGFCGAVEKLYQHGIRILLASGREYNSIIRIFPGMEKKLLVLSDNGALNYDGGVLIGDNSLPPCEIRSVYEAVQALPDVDIVLSGEFSGYHARITKGGLTEELALLSGSTGNISNLFTACTDPFSEAVSAGRIGKLAFYHRNDAWKACRNVLTPFMDQFQIFPSEPAWVNLMKKGVDKGLGIRQIQQYLGVTPAECMVFGDYLNDCCMFRAAEHTCAMANAHPDLKAIATCIAPSNEEEGVMQVLRQTFDFLNV